MQILCGLVSGKRQKIRKIPLELHKPVADEAQHSCHSSKDEVLSELDPSGYTCTSTTPDRNSNTQPELPNEQQSEVTKARMRTELEPTSLPAVISPTKLVSDSYTQPVSPAAAVPIPATAKGPNAAALAPAAPAAHGHPRSSKGELHEGKHVHRQADIRCTATGRPHASTVEQPDHVSADQSAHEQSASVPQQSQVATEGGEVGWSAAADHTVYDHAECPCSGQCSLDALVSNLPNALLPQRLRASGLRGNFLWRATYPIQEYAYLPTLCFGHKFVLLLVRGLQALSFWYRIMECVVLSLSICTAALQPSCQCLQLCSSSKASEVIWPGSHLTSHSQLFAPFADTAWESMGTTVDYWGSREASLLEERR